MARAKEIRGLPGAQKAAIMVLTMGEDRASRVFAMMDDEEIREISQNMVNLGAIDSTVIESLLIEFVSMISNTGTVQGTYETTERLLMKGLDKDRVNQIMEELRGPAGRTMWDKLRQRKRGRPCRLSQERVSPDRGGRVVEGPG